jgi:hypothetical protein
MFLMYLFRRWFHFMDLFVSAHLCLSLLSPAGLRRLRCAAAGGGDSKSAPAVHPSTPPCNESPIKNPDMSLSTGEPGAAAGPHGPEDVGGCPMEV